MNSQPFDAIALTTLLLLAVAMPLLGLWDFRRLLQWTAEGRADARVKTYRFILGLEWGLVAALTAWWLLAGRSLALLRLAPVAGGWQWLAIGLGLVATAAALWQMQSTLRSPQQLSELRGQIGALISLAPRNAAEHKLFGAVSVTAGICEEILYRGVLLTVLTATVGLWPAVGLSSLIFGLGHAYQGPVGIVKTALVGLVMALLTVFSGSLFVAMLLHAVIDLTSGRLMGAALRLDNQLPAAAPGTVA